MKVSVITVTLNSSKTILQTINSVNNQTYQNIEHIFIDGKSRDKSIEIIKRHSSRKKKVFSGKDKGIYDAMNKGIKISNGDIIIILNSDDVLSNKNTVSDIVSSFIRQKADIVYGNLVIQKNNKIFRKWISGKFLKNSFLKGWSPPHPAFVAKKKVYKKFGFFNLEYSFAADIELMYRFMEQKNLISYYLNKNLVIMRHGGVSSNSLKNKIKQNIENIKILKRNNQFKYFNFFINKLKHRLKQFYA